MGPSLRFEQVYRTRAGSVGNVLSGPLSTAAACAPLIAWLEGQAEEGMNGVLDLGCGDLEWIGRCEAIVSGGLAYFGVDAVENLIGHHRRLFPWFRGQAVDIEEFVAGTGMSKVASREIVILKEVLEFHCNGFVEQALQSISWNKGWRKLLISSSPGARYGERRGLRQGLASIPLDVERLSRALAHREEGWGDLGEVALRIDRPGGGEWLVFERRIERDGGRNPREGGERSA